MHYGIIVSLDTLFWVILVQIKKALTGFARVSASSFAPPSGLEPETL
jgi:hypothetical protein